MFDKITSRISKLSDGLDLDYVDPVCHFPVLIDDVNGMFLGSGCFTSNQFPPPR